MLHLPKPFTVDMPGCSTASGLRLFNILSGVDSTVTSAGALRSNTWAVQTLHLDVVALLDQLSRDDLENLVDTRVVSGRDFMASVHPGPAHTLVVTKVLGSISDASLKGDLELVVCHDNRLEDYLLLVSL